MASPNPSIDIVPIAGDKWSATIETPEGPVTAVGDTHGEAQAALEELLLIRRALEVTRARQPN